MVEQEGNLKSDKLTNGRTGRQSKQEKVHQGFLIKHTKIEWGILYVLFLDHEHLS